MTTQPTTDQLDFSEPKSLSQEDRDLWMRNLVALKAIIDAILARLTAAGIP